MEKEVNGGYVRPEVILLTTRVHAGLYFILIVSNNYVLTISLEGY